MVEGYSQNPGRFANQLKEYVRVFVGVALLLLIIMFAFAPIIIYIVYGEKYIGVVPIFRILCVNFFVNAGIRKLLTNAIYVMKRVKINLMLASLAGVLNIVLDLILIGKLGSQGAAIATVAVTVFISALEAAYVMHYLRGKGTADELKTE